MVNREIVDKWMSELKSAWEAKDVEKALSLFEHTKRYFERPFRLAKSIDEIRTYWQDILEIENIRLEYSIISVVNDLAVIHWENWFKNPKTLEECHLDGVFILNFDVSGNCREFRQWWFSDNK